MSCLKTTTVKPWYRLIPNAKYRGNYFLLSEDNEGQLTGSLTRRDMGIEVSELAQGG